jgi:hypothetical protein
MDLLVLCHTAGRETCFAISRQDFQPAQDKNSAIEKVLINDHFNVLCLAVTNCVEDRQRFDADPDPTLKLGL